MQTPSSWKARLPLFVVLGVLLAANAVLLVSYSLFYDDRFRALVQEQKDLERRQEEARQLLRKVEESQLRLTQAQRTLDEFFDGTLGARKERLAPLIEEIYRMTRAARLRPKSIRYTEPESKGGPGAIQIGFNIEGTYEDVKALLAEFEQSPSFLVVEGVTVSLNEDQPEILRIGVSVSHYFRPDGLPVRRGRAARAPGAAGSGGPPR